MRKKTETRDYFFVCLAWDSVFQEMRAGDLGDAFSNACWLVHLYPDAAIWVEREVEGERYNLAVFQGEDLTDG